jgi:hypothetical protein
LLSKNIKIKLYRTTILHFVLYGRGTWLLILREECRLRVFERIFGPKRDEVRGEWRKLHNEGLNDQYSPSNNIQVIKSRRMKWVGRVARMERRDAHRILVEKPERKRLLGRTRHRWEDNITMDLQEVGWGSMDWMIWLSMGQVLGTCKCGNEPSGSIKCGEFLK